MLSKLKLPKNPWLERWLQTFAEKREKIPGEKDKELLVQNLSLDKLTLRMLLTLVDHTHYNSFKFYDCRLSKNGFNLLNQSLAKLDPVSLEISFNPVADPKLFTILLVDR